MIEALKSDLTGAPIDDLNTEDLEVPEKTNSDEPITAAAKASNEMVIDIEEERNKEAYKETISSDIENIDTIKKRHKHYTKQWRTINKVIQLDSFDETENFPDIF